MTAAIIQLDNFRRIPASRRPSPQTLRDILHDAIAETVLQDYAAWPWPVLDRAIRVARQVLDDGQTYLYAIEAAEQIIADHEPPEKRDRRHGAFFALAARMIRVRLSHQPQIDYHRALCRARRVIDSGGTIGMAFFEAIGAEL